MNIALIEEIGQILFQGLQLGIQYGPEVIIGLKNAWHWATTSDTITADQQAAVDAAFEAAHTQVAAAEQAAQQQADGPGAV